MNLAHKTPSNMVTRKGPHVGLALGNTFSEGPFMYFLPYLNIFFPRIFQSYH